MTTNQELFNRFANQSTTLLSRVMLSSPLNRWCLTDDLVLHFVLSLPGTEQLEAFLITIDYRETVSGFVHPEVHISSMASELMYWQAAECLSVLTSGAQMPSIYDTRGPAGDVIRLGRNAAFF